MGEVWLRELARATPLPKKPPGPGRRTALGTVPRAAAPLRPDLAAVRQWSLSAIGTYL